MPVRAIAASMQRGEPRKVRQDGSRLFVTATILARVKNNKEATLILNELLNGTKAPEQGPLGFSSEK